MKKLVPLFAMVGTIALLISATPVRAQTVLWVASFGSDANVCSQISPCATFQGAISKGSVNQINCLNSGSYGGFTLTASITIDCGTGNVGTIAVGAGSAAINITAATSATIVLRHLSLNGINLVSYGINAGAFAGGSLTVEDCTIQNFSTAGINFVPTSNSRGLLQASNSQILNNSNGILVSPASGLIASVAFNKIETTGSSGSGIVFNGLGVVAGTMRDSVAAANGNNGVGAAASQVYFTVEGSSIIANLNNGILTTSAGSVVNVGNSTIGGNGTGVRATAGQLISFGNNQMSANGANGTFTSTVPLR